MNLTGSHAQAQEKPDFDEHPESAPVGMEVPPCPMRKLAAEIVFVTFRLPHFLHLIVSVAVEVVSTSKCSLQSLQTYS